MQCRAFGAFKRYETLAYEKLGISHRFSKCFQCVKAFTHSWSRFRFIVYILCINTICATLLHISLFISLVFTVYVKLLQSHNIRFSLRNCGTIHLDYLLLTIFIPYPAAVILIISLVGPIKHLTITFSASAAIVCLTFSYFSSIVALSKLSSVRRCQSCLFLESVLIDKWTNPGLTEPSTEPIWQPRTHWWHRGGQGGSRLGEHEKKAH